MDVVVIVTEEAKAGCTGGICRSAASTAIITGFLAVVTRLLDQVQYAAVFIYGPIALARLGRLVSVRHAVETVWRTTVGPVPGPI